MRKPQGGVPSNPLETLPDSMTPSGAPQMNGGRGTGRGPGKAVDGRHNPTSSPLPSRRASSSSRPICFCGLQVISEPGSTSDSSEKGLGRAGLTDF